MQTVYKRRSQSVAELYNCSVHCSCSCARQVSVCVRVRQYIGLYIPECGSDDDLGCSTKTRIGTMKMMDFSGYQYFLQGKAIINRSPLPVEWMIYFIAPTVLHTIYCIYGECATGKPF